MVSPKHSPALQVFLVEDHPAVRDGLALLLGQSGIAVGGHAGGAQDALAALGSGEGWSAAIIDLALEHGSGLDVLDELKVRAPALRVIVYSMHEEPELIREALARGAHGYVTKRDEVEQLIDAVLAVVAGKRYLSQHAERILAQPTDESLPPRERRIFDLLGEGYGISEIAKRLSLSVRTVESYCERLQDHLNLMGMGELRRAAINRRRSRTPR